MRIVAGQYGGRRLRVPEGRDVRPTSDKVRGAIFNALLSRVDLEGAQVLDVFCGSGALGLEALSRGAAGCMFIDKARTSLRFARENAETLGAENCKFIQADGTGLKACSGGAASLVFLDPPYDQGMAVPALQGLHDGGWLAAKAVCVLEVEAGFSGDLPEAYSLLNEKAYGGTCVLFLTYNP